ncbi:MAG: major facilitator superfamily domain-containing protein 1 [Candidatus Aminicenantes bacterium]|nr:major facilitator superfamily domain-containing protein 1 [Candidatus Aminicenantes bacterium]
MKAYAVGHELPPPPRVHRWLVLAIISWAMFGNYYIFDALNPVGPLLESQLHFSQSQIGLLDSFYNIAALIILLIGGVIIDRAGTRKAMVLFGVIAAQGGVLIALAPGGYWGMAEGRFLLGLGAEPLIVAITCALAKWFKGKELAFAMGLNLTIARFGSVAADNSRNWAGGLFSSWRPPLILAAAVGSLCIIAAVAYALFERRSERRFTLGRAGAADKLVFSDLLRFGARYWWVVGLCVTFYSVVFPFRRFANIYFQHARGVSPETAAFLNGLLPLTALVATPLFGLLADKVGRRAQLMAAGTGLLLAGFLVMTQTALPVHVPVAMLGVAFSLVPAVMWPTVAYLVDEKRLGTAFALMTFCQQVGWASTAWGLGRLNDAFQASAAHPAGYGPGMWLLTALGLTGLLFSWLLWRSERRSKIPQSTAP